MKKWPDNSVHIKFVSFIRMIKKTSWTNKQRTSGLGSGTHKNFHKCFEQDFLLKSVAGSPRDNIQQVILWLILFRALVSCFHGLNIIYPGDLLWHQVFQKKQKTLAWWKNASLEICASPSPFEKQWALIFLTKIEHIHLNAFWACNSSAFITGHS